MALSAGRTTAMRTALLLSVALAAATTVYEGGMVAVNAAGNLVPASANSALRVIGVSAATVANAGDAGALSADVQRGCFQFDNSASTDEIGAAHVGQRCYAVNDHTVALTSNGGARPCAGVIMGVDSKGVWVDFTQSASGVPLVMCLGPLNNDASDAAVLRAVAPIAGKITKVRTVLNAALATGDATLTGKINGTNITGGVVTVTQASSAAGDVDEATPTAANTVAPGDVISFTAGGASTAVSTSNIQIEITPN